MVIARVQAIARYHCSCVKNSNLLDNADIHSAAPWLCFFQCNCSGLYQTRPRATNNKRRRYPQNRHSEAPPQKVARRRALFPTNSDAPVHGGGLLTYGRGGGPTVLPCGEWCLRRCALRTGVRVRWMGRLGRAGCPPELLA